MDTGAKDQASSPVLPAPVARVFSWRWVWLALIIAVATGMLVGSLLWGTTIAEHGNAFDAGWKSSAAVLAILATFITVDRFRLSQREHHRQLAVDDFNQRDVIARQITDLSAKASDQLGSDKAAVRIGGLTDLERLAQSHPALRQTVADRICAYLRAPFQPPPDQAPRRQADPSKQPDTADTGSLTPEEIARRLELDVRRTAVQILTRHLRWPDDAPERSALFWEGISLNLRDATLVDFSLDDCRVADANFSNAQLHGYAGFSKARFDLAIFYGATFAESAEFAEATFGEASFLWASFAKGAVFAQATFEGPAQFDHATFSGTTTFMEATFTTVASFSEATFAEGAGFDKVTFAGNTYFSRATFGRAARFPGATFTGEAAFENASFTQAWFGEATNIRAAGAGTAAASRATWTTALVNTTEVHIAAARFDGALSFKGARVTDPGRAHSWPPPWRPERNPDDPDGPYILQARRER